MTSGGTIAGTPHDLGGKGWGTAETCKFCHTPHLAQAVTGAPLWNHQTTAQNNYALYSSATLNATQAQPGPTSKLCLSCHDGTVASDSFANAGVLQSGSHFMTATPTNLIGAANSLAMDHPIAFTYDQALVTADQGGLAAAKLVVPVSTNYVDVGKSITLYNGKVECASCHAVHDNQFTKFLRISNSGSTLCTKCHIL